MARPRLLDLYCCAGGAAMGYHRAGFEVVGVDIAPQPRYPFEFHQCDALEFDPASFDAVHASPPCQAFSRTASLHDNEYPDLVLETRRHIRTSGVSLYVIENVVGAPLVASKTIGLCGSMFDLQTDDGAFYLQRHRLFECSFSIAAPRPCSHGGVAISCYGASESRDAYWAGLQRGTRSSAYQGSMQDRREAMDIDWMIGQELSEAIPPAYTEYIGRKMVELLCLT